MPQFQTRAPQQTQIPQPQVPQVRPTPNTGAAVQQGIQQPDIGLILQIMKMKQLQQQQQPQISGQTPQQVPVPQASPVPGAGIPASVQQGIPQRAPNPLQSSVPQNQQVPSIGDLLFQQGARGGR